MTVPGTDHRRLALDRLSEIAKLPEDWDSYGAKAIDPECVERAEDFINKEILPSHGIAPFVVPSPSGGVQLEWERGEHSLEIEFLPDGTTGYLYLNGDGEISGEGDDSARWFYLEFQKGMEVLKPK